MESEEELWDSSSPLEGVSYTYGGDLELGENPGVGETPHEGHRLASFICSSIPRLTNNCRHGPALARASHPPLTSNWWQTSASLVAEPRTPEPLYTPYRQRHRQELGGESLEDVIESRFSSLSDVSAMSALTPSSPSTYLPSYTTSISTPPSYSTEAGGGVSRSPSANGSYENPR